MKQRISLTLDPVLTRSVKARARKRGISVSGWVEQLLAREIREAGEFPSDTRPVSARWGGRLRLRKGGEPRRTKLIRKYSGT